MKITILSVGKKHDQNLAVAINDYCKRITYKYKLEWHIIAPSGKTDQLARQEESKSIADKIKPNNIIWLLDEDGENISSPTLANKLKITEQSTKDLTIIIGGAYGVSEDLKANVDFVWSLSKLVFPHQLVRLIVAEQMYRAIEINRGSQYHHS